MKVTFVSNYINHHQIPVSNVLYEHLGAEYTFIQTEPMEEERIKLGWNPEEVPEYVKYAYEEPELCRQLIIDSDVVIWGGLEEEEMLRPRLQAGKPVIRYSERLYKEAQWKAISPRGLRKKYLDHTRYRNAPVYMLCSGAFVASDFHIVRAYPNKMFKWGYFPECREYDLDALMAGKEEISAGNGGKTEILWAARFIDWKHPELVVQLAKELKYQGKSFHITMIGDGELRPKVEEMIAAEGLEDVISLTGSQTPAQVRTAMENTSVFLMTSDRKEGWGAVMNEAMNSGCAVVADRMEGATLFLMKQGENGFWYKDASAKCLADLVGRLLEDKKLRETIGRNAYRTIADLWNARVAAERLLKMCETVAAGKEPEMLWTQGPCSKAEIIKER